MKMWFFGVATLGVATGVAFAYTATLDDFKEAVKHQFCDSIPYSDLRGECADKSRERDEWCKTKEFRCKDLDPRGLQQQIDNLNGKIKDLKDQRDALKDKSPSDDDERKKIEEQIADLEKKIDELSKKVDEMQHRLDEEKHLIDDRIYNGEHCLDARTAVQDKFDRARSAASSESDEQIKPLAQQLIDHWDRGTEQHKEAFANTRAAIDLCKSFK